MALALFQITATESRPIVLGICGNDGADIIADFKVLSVVPTLIITIGSSFSAIFLPRSSEMYQQKDVDSIRRFSYKWTGYTNKDGNISCMSTNTDKGLALVDEFLKSSDTVEAYERDYGERLEYAPALREPARRSELSSKYAGLIKKFSPATAIRLTLFPVLLSRNISLLKVRIKGIVRNLFHLPA